MLGLSFNVLIGVASFLYIVVGIPQLLFLIRKKKTEGLALTSFWLYYSSSVFFAIFGFLVANDQIVYSEFCASIIFGIQLGIIVKYIPKEEFSLNKRIISYLFVVIYISNNLIFTVLNALKIIGTDIDPNPNAIIHSHTVIVLSAIIANIAPVLSMIAFLPQVIKGIKSKSLYKQPFTFVIVIVISSTTWVVSWILGIAYFSETNPSIVPTYIISCIYQIISLGVTSTQLSVWTTQVKKNHHLIWF
ncbi:PQ-loop domain-containing transporter [[Mycoplasma] testudinis]|uniref:PQ-loop domain-containing transporter n=1 Tax=[Mycoplasma] testudinis TaxID=33924 RepID=UPI0004819785|nr:PQ-loop domain-containing transporter [[Mycoplasma] testudinis]